MYFLPGALHSKNCNLKILELLDVWDIKSLKYFVYIVCNLRSNINLNNLTPIQI